MSLHPQDYGATDGAPPAAVDSSGRPTAASSEPVQLGDLGGGQVPVHTFDANAAPEQKAAATAAQSRFGGKITGGVGKIGSGIGKVGGGVLGGVSTVGHGVVGGVSTVGHGVVGGVSTVGGGVISAGRGGVSALGNVLDAVPGMPSKENRSFGTGAGGGGRAVAIDLGSGDAPTVDIASIQKASEDEARQPEQSQKNQDGIVGWLNAAGITSSSDRSTDDTRQPSEAYRWITEHIPLKDDFYGTVYHNAAIIVFAVLATRFVTVLRFGWTGTIVVLAFCTSMYSLSIERTRARARDDIQRELVKVRLVTETESAEWINSLLHRAWLILEPVLSATIVASVDDALKAAAPPGIESIRMTTFTLGNKAPKIDSVRTYPNTPDDEVIMEWALSFTPNDLEDLTPRQARGKVNPKVVLAIKLGKGMVGATLPVLLEDISFTGMLRIKLKLISNFPHVSKVSISFMEKPNFDYVLKPLGGERFGMDINQIPGLAGFIKEQVHANLGPMMYDPNVFTIDLESLLSGTPLDSAIGVLKVTVESARGLKAVKLGGGNPDPYVSLGLAAKPAVARTKTIANTQNPTWSESQFLLINTLTDTLSLSLYDYNDHRADNLLGVLTHELTSLAEDAAQEGIVGKVLSGGKDRGELRYSLSYYPVVTRKMLPDGTLEVLPETHTGIARLTIHQAKDLDLARVHGTLSPCAKVFLGKNQQIHRTPTIKASNTPVWESPTEFLVSDKNKSTVTIRLFDDREMSREGLGSLTVRLVDLITARESGNDWFPLQGVKSGKVRLTLDWKPLNIPGGMSGAASYAPPIGVIRLWAHKAIDVKNVEAGMGGKSDPYLRVLANNRVVGRTDVVNNNLNPVWDQILYLPVHSTKERFLLEVMDYQNLTKDRSLGLVELNAGAFIRPDESKRTLYASTGKQHREDRIGLGHNQGFKGQLVYEAEFLPCVNLRGGVSFDAVANEVEQAVRREANGGSNDTPIASATASETAAVAVPTDNGNHLPSIGEDKALVTAEDGDDSEGVAMSTQQLLSTQSGLLVCQMVSGQLSRRGRLEVLLDENYWPAFSTLEKSRSHQVKWDEIGEGFVKELDFSQITLRLNNNDESEKEEIFAELKMSTRDFLERAMAGRATFQLPGVGGEGRCQVVLSAKYVPVDVVLEARESINNMGHLKITLVDGADIRGVDRSGKSDPYVVFHLNGERVYKSQTQKKTLNPQWNERFEVLVPSRVAADFTFEVFDWNQLEAAKSLGKGKIDVTNLEPFQMSELEVPVHSDKHGDKGRLRLQLNFQPDVIMKVRKNTSTFSNAGRTMTTIGAAPINVGKGVGKGVFAGGKGIVHGVGHVGGFAGRKVGLVKKKDAHGNEIVVEEELPEDDASIVAPSTPSKPSRVLADNESVREGSILAGAATFSIRCVGGRALNGGSDIKPYVQFTIGKKSHKTSHGKHGTEPDWNESFTFTKIAPDAAVAIKVFDHKTLGKDKELDELTIHVSTDQYSVRRDTANIAFFRSLPTCALWTPEPATARSPSSTVPNWSYRASSAGLVHH